MRTRALDKGQQPDLGPDPIRPSDAGAKAACHRAWPPAPLTATACATLKNMVSLMLQPGAPKPRATSFGDIGAEGIAVRRPDS